MFLSLANEIIRNIPKQGDLRSVRESEAEGHSWSDSFGSRDDSSLEASLVSVNKCSRYFVSSTIKESHNVSM